MIPRISGYYAFRNILLGTFLGAVVFTAGYGIDILMQSAAGDCIRA
ncbi:MAG: hypothetical protein LBN31_10940 [Hungatella sp.]|jgi:hypothetical protein|nr:hypothetical protein [Hungatella sp.]